MVDITAHDSAYTQIQAFTDVGLNERQIKTQPVKIDLQAGLKDELLML